MLLTKAQGLGLLAGGGGSAPYHADAVHFDPNGDPDCRLQADDAISVNTPLVSWAGWFLIPADSFSNGAPTFCNGLANWIEAPGVLWDAAGQLYVHVYGADPDNEYLAQAVAPTLSPDTWYWCGGNVDFGHDAGSRTNQLYIGDVAVELSPDNDGIDTGVASDIPFTTLGSPGGGEPVLLRSNTEIMEYADILVWPGQKIDWSVQATRRLLFGSDGKPVNPAAAVNTLGNPAMFFSGDETGFQTNQGNGPTFTHTMGTITNASTSPSD